MTLWLNFEGESANLLWLGAVLARLIMRAVPLFMMVSAGFGLLACAAPESVSDVALVTSDQPAEADLPVARWDHKPQAAAWTETALAALDGPAARLVDITPADIETWCPGYATADEETRKAFWVGLVSALAKHESTWRPNVSGGDNQWHGLLQIAPATARGYSCEATTPEDLKTGPANLDCGLRILATTIPRDGVISAKGGGAAADWAPFLNAEKHADMVAWTRSQSYCQATQG